MIKFTDFIVPPDPKRTKIKFNKKRASTNEYAWDLLLDDDFGWEYMNAYRKEGVANHNLDKADYLIALAQYYPYSPEYYVFGGLFKVGIILPKVVDGTGYTLTLMESYQEYIKRLIIKIEKPIERNLYNRKYESIQTQLKPEIYELAPSTKLGHFPGYQSVSLKHRDLQQIVTQNEPSWKQALSNVKGVYVITDMSNGKLYIGSASGNSEGIWQRWSAYADKRNLTGGNKGFIEIIEAKNEEYLVQNFKYSILEIFDTKTKTDTIIERENYWKNVFASRKHGMNYN